MEEQKWCQEETFETLEAADIMVCFCGSERARRVGLRTCTTVKKDHLKVSHWTFKEITRISALNFLTY